MQSEKQINKHVSDLIRCLAQLHTRNKEYALYVCTNEHNLIHTHTPLPLQQTPLSIRKRGMPATAPHKRGVLSNVSETLSEYNKKIVF